MKKFSFVIFLFFLQISSCRSQEPSLQFNNVYSFSLDSYFSLLESNYNKIEASNEANKDVLLKELNRLLSQKLYVLNKFPLDIDMEINRHNVEVVSEYQLAEKFQNNEILRVVEISPIKKEGETFISHIRIDQLSKLNEKINHLGLLGNTKIQFEMDCEGKLKFVGFGNIEK